VSETLAAILDESGYEAALRTEGSQTRLDNLAELKQSVYEFESQSGEEVTVEHYLQHAALFTNADLTEKDDRVKLMTVHAAKGLEFDHVFLVALNEGIFPSKKTKTLAGMEEERRLAFVAMTRARNSLFLSESAGRNQDGSTRYPSRFILDIGKGLITFDPELTDGFLDDARRFVSYRSTHLVDGDGPSVFEVGESVRHPVFGIGTIELIDTEHQAYVIRFPKMMTPRRIAFSAKLEAA
jgi:DNA helicase-2/ATP-dependent DNA helicase PcrA